jgi:predicted ester cyclase
MTTNDMIPDWSPGRAMSPEQIKVFYKLLYEEVWNKGDLNSVSLLYPFDIKSILAPSTPWSTQDLVSPEQFVTIYRTAFPDINVTLEEQILEVDSSKIVTRWAALGTHTGALFDIPPTGKQVTVTGITIRHLFTDRAGRARSREMWMSWDVMGLMQQLK